MKKITISFLIMFTVSLVFCQQNSMYTNLGVWGTSRILKKSGSLTKDERNTVQDLEIIKPSFNIESGYSIITKRKNKIILGFGFRHMRFGTKIYKLPSDAQNSTPQYQKRKDIARYNQNYIFFEYQKKIKRNHHFAIVSKISLIYNGFSTIYAPTYNLNSIKGLTYYYPESFVLNPPFNINIGAGVIFSVIKKDNVEVSLKPNISFFVLPYKTANYSYLYFLNKYISGYLWDFGLSIQTNFEFKTNDN